MFQIRASPLGPVCVQNGGAVKLRYGGPICFCSKLGFRTYWAKTGRSNSKATRNTPITTALGGLLRGTAAVVIGVFLVALLFERPVFAQYVRNPSFEQKQIGPPYLSFTAPPFWTHTGPNGDALIWNILYPGTGVAAPGGGNQFVTLGGGILGPVKQYSEWVTTISGLSPGQTYRLGFWIANEGFSVSQTI